jgi:hypothetical protein
METTARRGAGTLIRVRFTPETLAFQLFYHEVHHRAQVMAMLRQLGVAAEGLDFNRYAFEWTELGTASGAGAPRAPEVEGGAAPARGGR